MPICYDAGTRQFHLYNGRFSYIIKALEDGSLGQVYCGPPLEPSRSYPLLAPLPFWGFSNNDRNIQRFEYPVFGKGDYRLPALVLTFPDGSGAAEPVYQSYRIMPGKPEIEGLPAVYAASGDEAETLELLLRDEPSGLEILLSYTIFSGVNCLARHARLVNRGRGPVTIRSAMSLSLDLEDANWNLVVLTGSWAREFQPDETPLHPGIQGIRSMRGNSGHQQNPFLLLKRPLTTDFAGEALAVSLVYSGNFRAAAEVDSFGITRLQAGINPETFAWELGPGAAFDTPEAVLAYSSSGVNHLSQDLHQLYRTRLARGRWRDAARPVQLNNWEGTYFNFTESKLVEMAALAKEMGIELFVLDDGWFGQRDADNSSLGDWFADTRKLPGGIPALAKRITALGLKFGLWIEPEMISEKSRLFEAHPDWAIGVPGRKRSEQRQQYVLDFSRPEIVDHIFNVLKDVLASAPVAYVKWDMNRSITEPFSASLPPERQGEFFHRYILGVYRLYGLLTEAFPDILFESCAGGGGRFDPGMLACAPMGWLSDNTDAFLRIGIQSAASLCYPLSSMGTDVSAVPNHQTGRGTSLSFRAMTAFFGVLGFQLDPAKLSESERRTVALYTAFYKSRRELFQFGRFTRLSGPGVSGGDSYAAWMVSSPDEAAVGFYKLLARPNRGPCYLRLQDLDAAAVYEVSFWEEGGFIERDKALNCGLRGGDELMNAGLRLDSEGGTKGDFFSELILLKRR